MKKNKKVPRFKNEDEERKFWAEHDSTEYIDWEKAEEAVFPDLKPTTKTISLRLPVSMLYRLKQLANQADVPYQSLIKMILAEKLAEESSRLPDLMPPKGVPVRRIGDVVGSRTRRVRGKRLPDRESLTPSPPRPIMG